MRWLAFATGLLCLATVLSAVTKDPATSNLISFGPLEFLKPILLNVVSKNTLLSLQTNIGNAVQAVTSGNTTKILAAVLAIVDPMNVTRTSLMILGNYESHMWDDGFRQQVGGLLKGFTKAFSSGIACFSQITQDNLNNFTSNFVVAMDKAFVANRPNSTTPRQTGLAGVQTAAFSTARLIFDILRSSEMRQTLINGIRGMGTRFQEAFECARANATDVITSWQSLTRQLTGVTVAPPTTTTKASSSFWGIF